MAPFSGRSLLVRASDGAVEHKVCVVAVGGQRVEHPLPDVAVDRTSKLVFARIYCSTTKLAAAAFLKVLVKTVPYRIHAVLTDSPVSSEVERGVQFVQPQRGTNRGVLIHIFERVFVESDIEHRLTKPYPSLDQRPGRAYGPHHQDARARYRCALDQAGREPRHFTGVKWWRSKRLTPGARRGKQVRVPKRNRWQSRAVARRVVQYDAVQVGRRDVRYQAGRVKAAPPLAEASSSS